MAFLVFEEVIFEAPVVEGFLHKEKEFKDLFLVFEEFILLRFNLLRSLSSFYWQY